MSWRTMWRFTAPVRLLGLTPLLAAVIFTPFHTHAFERVVRDDLAAIFDEADVNATFALLEIPENRLTLVNAERAQQRFFPASTFKIANSLIALETGAVADAHEIIPYGGKPQRIKAWQRDMSMRDAIAVSNVPVYQELARRIGLKRYREWLARLGYGNENPGSRVDDFWLVGPLAISAVEQVMFLAQLSGFQLDAGPDNQNIVRDMVRIETRDTGTLHAKSGWSAAPDPQIGWWVGWIDDGAGSGVAAFALNLDVTSQREVDLREPLVRALLARLHVWSSDK